MTDALTKEDFVHFREELQRLQHRVGDTLDELEGVTLGTRGDPVEHEGDRRSADVEFEEADLDALESEGDTVTQIAGALDRIDAGTYGRCVECGKWIPRGRLEAVPYAARCVSCQEAVEEA